MEVNKYQSTFNSTTVEELLSISDDKYTHPLLPFKAATFTKRVPFGREMKLAHFLIDPTWTFLNHGAFGAVLREVLDTSHKWQTYVETQPLRAIDRDLLPLLVSVIRKVAKFVSANPLNVVLVPNATTATTAVLKSFPFQPGDGILYLSIVYAAVLKQISEVAKLKSLVVYEREIQFPVTNNEYIIKLVETALKECPNLKLAVFDHISSGSAVLLPVKQLIDICHKSGVKVLIDGAHALGNIPINLTDMDPDFYTSNAHKWFCGAKGSAFLFVKKEFQSAIHPLVISHGYTRGFQAEFAWIGSKDYSALIALNTAIDFWEYYGADNIREYIHGLNRKAATMLVNTWGTQRIAAPELFRSMSVVIAPLHKICTSDDGEKLQDWLHHEKKIECSVKEARGILAVRISTHVHNDMEDYVKLADAVMEYCKQSTVT
ncbi:L-cysteine desulfhydrase 1 isoform X2 [Oopsacas minuta]|uniref:L-cysteine desulfhydrase 1 isoform X2 n=1 Tax=Oopsacas minuta TaxID=111878 RepID=A0AAV7JYY0_9METZ|nr:L-cysteine desulfhydrase 1 isoform X2 [Oopsacas minuta]